MLARTDNVSSVKGAVEAKIAATNDDGDRKVLLATGRLEDFRSCYGTCTQDGIAVTIDAQAARTLDVSEGDSVWNVSR